jgi:dethiobiotin synthetase
MSTTPSFFVTGTDTEVGKTLISGALILKLRELGAKALGFKPVVAGTYRNNDGQILNEDLETLRIASKLAPGQLNICPYILATPAAPHLVAKDAGVKLDLAIMERAFKEVLAHGDCLVVEGAGGFLVPINEQENLSQFAERIKLPVILVVGMKLGCLNHALLTVEALKSRNLKIAGWVANTLSNEMPFLIENLETLQSKIKAPFLGLVPALPSALQKTNNSPYSIEALKFAAQHLKLPTE